MSKITPHFWFDSNALEAVEYYVSIFPDSKILNIDYYGEAGAEVSGQPENTVQTVQFQLSGQDFYAINGGPIFQFTPAISMLIDCKEEEYDKIYDAIALNGEVMPCGWITDQFGLTWQVVPTTFGAVMEGDDPVKRERMLKELFTMTKIDVARLKKVYEEGM